MIIPALADEIEAAGSWEPDDAIDLHRTLQALPRAAAALAASYERVGTTLEATNIHPDYPEAVHEAAARLHRVAEDLSAVVGGGVMRGGGS